MQLQLHMIPTPQYRAMPNAARSEDLLNELSQNGKNTDRLFDTVFDFLRRKTDFYTGSTTAGAL